MLVADARNTIKEEEEEEEELDRLRSLTSELHLLGGYVRVRNSEPATFRA